MAIKTYHNQVEFGVGDKIRVTQKVAEGEKTRLQTFEGTVIAIKGRKDTRTFTVRRIGVQQIGIEKIFPLNTPTIEKIEVIKKGTAGVRRAKLYYIRKKARREIEKIYSRAARKSKSKSAKKTAKK